MDDLISRQAAIDALYHVDEYNIRSVEVIRNLPSAQTTQNNRVNSNNALDTISRQAAIYLFPNDTLEQDTKGGYIAPHLARRMIEELPSAQLAQQLDQKLAQPDVPDTNIGDTISRLSDLRSQYNCFDESERDAYGTLSEAIKVLSAQPDLDEWCTDCKEYDQERHSCPRWNRVIRETLKDAQPEPHEIGYSECADAMLKMWIDNVLTDGEYSRIMDKLNAHWAERREE